MSTSSDSAETTPLEQTIPRGAVTTIHDRVENLANGSIDRTEFLQLLANDLRGNFGAAIVAIHASHWSSPMMLVVDDPLAQQIQREAVRDLLVSATLMPIASDVPICSPTADSVRGIRVELSSDPERVAVLVIYADGQQPTTGAQIEDLKQLSTYAEATQSVVTQLRVTGGHATLPVAADASQPAPSQSSENRKSLRLFHLNLDVNATSYRVANETRRLLGCDRTTILIRKSGRLRVNAVSGVSVFNARSNSIRAVERLSQAAVVMSHPLLLPSEEPLPPQVQEPLDEYLDESGVMCTVLLPLYAPDPQAQADGIEAAEIDPFDDKGELVGVMVLEYFAGSAPSAVDPAMTMVASEATLSLRNALEHNRVFGLRLWKSVGGLIQSSRMSMVMGAFILAICLLLASMLYQVEHYVIATGSVEPSSRRDVFATVDGIVKQLRVNDGDTVEVGDVLLELENAELENRAETLSGEIQTITRRLASIQAVRLSKTAEPGQSSRLALEQGELESQLSSLRAQQAVVDEQQKELLITSPISGTVIGWQLERRLANRPVTRGNLLVTIADPQGPWSLRLRLPDRDAGPVLSAVKKTRSLPIRFAVATQPEATFAASLQSLATAARLDESGAHVIDATANVAENTDTFATSEMRAGADVTAKIACGNRSVLRSWFSDVFDFAHRNVLFYF